MPTTLKLFTKTFGCQMNTADSEEMTRHFKDRGFVSSDDQESADAVLVNTCTVRDLAEHKASSYIGRLKDWKDEQPERMIVVTGCAAERAKDEFKRRFPHIDLIVGAKDIETFPSELDGFLKNRPDAVTTEPDVNEDLAKAMDRPVPADFTLSMSPVLQYVTIMRGCNYNCSYCIVPSVRGREVYRPKEDILKDVAARVAEGAKEIWLLGQTVNSYRPADNPNYDFANLLADVCAVEGTQRVRYISPHPHYLSQKLIDAMAANPKSGEHLHLPVQSGSDAMLKKMKRNYTRDSFMKGIRALRAAIPNIALSTDIIVGFPGETEEDYQQTLSLVREADFDSAYCFQYSPRPGTASADWEDDVPAAIKETRVNELLALTDQQGTAKAARLVGTIQEVLIEDDKGNGVFRGKTRGAWRVRTTNPTLTLGQTVQMRITGTHSRELHGELI